MCGSTSPFSEGLKPIAAQSIERQKPGGKNPQVPLCLITYQKPDSKPSAWENVWMPILDPFTTRALDLKQDPEKREARRCTLDVSSWPPSGEFYCAWYVPGVQVSTLGAWLTLKNSGYRFYLPFPSYSPSQHAAGILRIQ